MPPQLSALNPGIPPKLDEIISRALEKDRDLRYQSASDLRAELKRFKRDTEAGRQIAGTGTASARHASEYAQEPRAGTAAAQSVHGRRWPLAIVGLVALIAASGLVWFAIRRLPPTRPEPKPRRLTANPAGNPAMDAHISPDGKYLAYDDQAGIHLQLIDTGENRAIPAPQGLGYKITDWSPVGWFPD